MFKSLSMILKKYDKSVGTIQSGTFSNIRERPYPMEPVKDIIEVECSRFMVFLPAISDNDRFCLLENFGFDFTFGIAILQDCGDGLVETVWNQDGFKFCEPISAYSLGDKTYVLEWVKVIKDLREPVYLNAPVV